MLIIQTEGDITHELVQEMLNIERGERAGNSWPIITLPPKTKSGSPITIQYKSTVGIVYFASNALGKSTHFDIPNVVNNVYKEISRHTDHLAGYRAVSASTSAISKHRNRINTETIIHGPSSKKVKLILDPLEMPARILKWSFDNDIPAQFSKGSAFTWYFLPIEACVDLAPNCSENVNALVSSIFIDEYKLTKFNNGDITLKLTYNDFKISDMVDIRRKHIKGVFLACSNKDNLTYVGNPSYLQLPKGIDHMKTVTVRKMTETQCLSCYAPFADTAVFLDVARTRTGKDHAHNYLTPSICSIPARMFLCEFCWNSINPSCKSAFVVENSYRIKVKTPQSELIDKALGIDGIKKCLTGNVKIVHDGVYVIYNEGQQPIILTAEKWGDYPPLALSQIILDNIKEPATLMTDIKLAFIEYGPPSIFPIVRGSAAAL